MFDFSTTVFVVEKKRNKKMQPNMILNTIPCRGSQALAVMSESFKEKNLFCSVLRTRFSMTKPSIHTHVEEADPRRAKPWLFVEMI